MYPSTLRDNSKKIRKIIILCNNINLGDRDLYWNSYRASITNKLDYENNNSYLMLKKINHVRNGKTTYAVLSGGEIFFTLGDIDESFSDIISELLEKCTKYRLEIHKIDYVLNQIYLSFYWII